MARAFGCDVYGMELSRFRAQYAKARGIKVIGWDQVPGDGFDFINAEQVFEHLAEPLETLHRLGGCLKPGGLIKVSVPDGGDIKRRLKVLDWAAPKGSRNSLNPVSPLEHINCFSRGSLIRMAGLAGLEPARIPLGVEYAAATDWRPLRRMCGNMLRPLRSRLSPGTYVFFRRTEGAACG